MITALAGALMLVHAGIALVMVWIGLTVPKNNLWLLVLWFCISILTLVTIGKLLP